MSIVTKERFVKKELFAGGVFTSKSNVVANFGHQSFYDILMSFEICGGDFEEMVEKVRTEHGWTDTSPSNKSIESEGVKSPEKFLGEDPPENIKEVEEPKIYEVEEPKINDMEEPARSPEVIDLDQEMDNELRNQRLRHLDLRA